MIMWNYEDTELLNQPRSTETEEAKQCLESFSDEEKILALKQTFKYGKKGFNLAAKIFKEERGMLQLIAYDSLWDKANLKGKKKLLKYLSKHPEICVSYIEKVLEPSLIAMREEQEQRHQTLAQICNTQELLSQQYQQALFRASEWEQGERDRSISGLPINCLRVKQDEQPLKDSESDAHLIKKCVSTIVRENLEKPTQSASIKTKILSQEASALKAKLDQQTALINNLLPDLALISKLFEVEARKHLFEAQIFANAIEEGEKALLQIEVHWQKLESLTTGDTSSIKLLQRLEFLISEMQEQLILLRQTVARAITTQLHVQHHYNLAKKAATYCKHRAKLDWQEGNKNWARESLVRRQTYLDTATILKFSLEQQTPQLDTFKCYLFVLQSWLSLAKEMKDRLNVGSSSASAQIAQALLWRRIEFPYSTCMMSELERSSLRHNQC